MSRFLAFAAVLLCATFAQAAKPNIVLILADDLGVSDLRCYGREDHRTPHLDRLAGEGARFTSAYCAQPICSPSRAALLTGKAPARLHLTTFLPGRADAKSQKLLHPQMRQSLPLAERTLAERLKENGYATALVGKWHLGGKGFQPTEQGFDFYYAGQANTKPSETEGGKGEYDLTRKAGQFIREHRDGPFFLMLSHNTPHIVFTARTNLVQENAGAFNPLYAALIQTMDDSVGQLLRTIDSLGLRDDTVVIFTSDNGGLHAPEGPHKTVTHNRPFRAGKGFLYEGGLRVPLMVRWPGKIGAGRAIEHPVINTDMTATIMELAGLASSETRDAESFAGLLTGSAPEARRKLFWHFPHYTNQGGRPGGAVRDGDWKLIEHYEDGRVELFNLREDASEARNLAEREPERAGALQRALADWRAQVQAQTNAINPAFDAALHRAIYTDYDISRYDPPGASAADGEKALKWRRLMDQAVRR